MDGSRVLAAVLVAALAVTVRWASAASVATLTSEELCFALRLRRAGAPCPPGRPSTSPQGGKARRALDLTEDEICKIVGGPLCPEDETADPPARTTTPRPESTAVSDEEICRIFGGPLCSRNEVSDPPPGPPAEDTTPTTTAALDQDELCHTLDGSGCLPEGVSKPPPQGGRQARQAPSQDLSDGEICEIFGGPACPAAEDKAYHACSCPGDAESGCQCVPYYMCPRRADDQQQQDLIDIRKQTSSNSTCEHYLHECCNPSEQGQGVAGGTDALPEGPQDSRDTAKDDATTPPPQLCGVRNRNGVGTRISGGLNDESNFGEIPWMVAIFKKRGGGPEYLCGGGLIAPNVVLTAAHCISNDMTGSSLMVRAGEWDSRTEDEVYKHQDRDVDAVITHPGYKRKTLHNNMGLLVLREPVRIGYHIGIICLPEQGQHFDDRSCLVSGWGKDRFGKEGVYQNILRLIEDLPVVPHSQCQDKLRRTRLGARFNLDRSFMCAGGIQGRDACTQGDGGSPLVCPMTQQDDTRYVYAGIVSWGIGCGDPDVPGVYADVATFRTWIEETLRPYNVQLCS